MCGIAGFFDDKGNHLARLREMLEPLVHRGPDSRGDYQDQNFVMGMTRLSINGLVDGNQPLYNESKSVAVVYNGEIYNSAFLRSNLESRGFKLNSTSDGEVLCHLYELYGLDMFEHLDGMYAVALWDSERRRLVLGRDRLGEKPLYYMSDGPGRFCFASEIKAVQRYVGEKLTLDKQALWDFPTFLWVPEPQTIYEEVLALPPGSILVCDDTGNRLKEIQDRTPQPPANLAFDDLVALTRETVTEAVISRLLSEVPVGAFLSGGLDSSIVTAVMARELGEIETFSVAFEDMADPYGGHLDESEYSKLVSRHLGVRHNVTYLQPDDLKQGLDDFAYHADQPFGVSSGLGIQAVAAEAYNRGIKVLLSGDGADECFGGYDWYLYLGADEPGGSQGVELSMQDTGVALDERLASIRRTAPKDRALAWHYYATESDKAGLFSGDAVDGHQPSRRHFSDLANDSAPVAYIAHDRRFYFRNEMLRKLDRMTMAKSIEARVPFAAPPVMALADTLQYQEMVHGGELKAPLRKAFSDMLPEEIIARPKHGFNVPIDHWLKNEWSDLLERTFAPGSALMRQGFIRKDSDAAAREMLHSPSRLSGHTLFCFIMLDIWLVQQGF